MYAIVETGGKQYNVKVGDEIYVEKLDLLAGDTLSLDSVVLVGDDSTIKIGNPYVQGAKVVTQVVKNGKKKKIIVFKFKAKKGYRKKQGHRQPYTKLCVKEITL